MIIQLTQGKSMLIDDRDAHLFAAKWYFNGGYAKHCVSYGKILYAHRVIMGASPEQDVDHINRDKLDNRRANLRFATASQGNANRVNARNTSGYRGVRWHKGNGRWFAAICVNRKHIHIGAFRDPRRAALAYDLAAYLHFGEFAQLNGV